MKFSDRFEAGRQLAHQLGVYRDHDPIVLALPRGGVPVAYEVARALDAPLDILVARKLGAPGHAEYGIGAVAQGGGMYLEREAIASLGVSSEYMERVARAELDEIDRRLRTYRGPRPPFDVFDRTAIVVDDGLATGVTMRAAVRSLHSQHPKRIVVAVPVCSPDAAASLRLEVDDVVCAAMPDEFRAVGPWYEDFTQTTDAEVVELLERAAREHGVASTFTSDEAPQRASWPG